MRSKLKRIIVALVALAAFSAPFASQAPAHADDFGTQGTSWYGTNN